MADLTTATTFTYSVQGNRRIVLAEVGAAAGTTQDTVVIPYLTAITGFYGQQHNISTAAELNITPQLFIGTSANNALIIRSSLTTADPFRFYAEGR